MSQTALRSVPNFQVIRDGVGKIEWLEPVDLVGVDVLKEVKIEPGQVNLFKCYAPNAKPLPGTKLNKRALITIENARPDADEDGDGEDGGSGGEQMSIAEYAQLLREHCANQGIRFHSYDGLEGRFQFIVSSF